jgi:hypothetical protein
MIIYQQEKFEDVYEQLAPLFEEHYREIAMYKDKISLNPDYEAYLGLGDSLVCVTARDGETIVGYSFYFVKPHIHYKDHLYAYNDIIFLDKNYRGGETALQLTSLAEDTLYDLGVSVITMHMKSYAPFETLMKVQGFEKIEYLYSKYIGD